MSKTLKTVIVVGIIVILACIITWLIIDRAKTGKGIDYWKGVAQTTAENAKIAIAQRDAVIETHQRKIQELNGMIDSSNTIIGNLKDESSDHGKVIKELEEKNVTLTDYKLKYENAEARAALWQEKFSLSDRIVAEKDKQIAAYKEKELSYQSVLNNQVKAFAELMREKIVLEKVISQQNWQIKKYKAGNLFDRTVQIALAAYAGYTLIKK